MPAFLIDEGKEVFFSPVPPPVSVSCQFSNSVYAVPNAVVLIPSDSTKNRDMG